jgi:hypothetical protein
VNTVVVANASVGANTAIVMTLKTVGGAITGDPYQVSITAGVGFSIKASSGDTSTYNYLLAG